MKVAALGSPISDPIVVNTVRLDAALDIIGAYANQLNGKVLVDVNNSLNETYDDLATPPGTSVAEELARVAPKDTKVVKAFNTIFAGLLTQGHVGGQPLDVFIAGDDPEAKATVTKLIEDGGQRVIDAGPLRRARQLEGLGLLIVTIQSQLDKPWMSAFKVVE